MIWPFNKNTSAEQLAISMIKAAAEGAERARLTRALATVSIQLDTKLDDKDFCVKAIVAIIRDLAKAAKQTPIWIDDDRRFTAGIFSFTLANAVSFRLGAIFEIVANRASWILISSDNDEETVRDIDDLVSAYNDLTKQGRVPEAIDNTFSNWLFAPTRDNYTSLVGLYSMLSENVGFK